MYGNKEDAVNLVEGTSPGIEASRLMGINLALSDEESSDSDKDQKHDGKVPDHDLLDIDEV